MADTSETRETMALDELLSRIMQAKIAWESTSSLLSPVEQEEVPVAGEWKVKDLYAHLAWHERQMLEWLRAGRFVGSDWWNLPLHERNNLIYQESKAKSAEDIRQESRDVHEALVKTLEGLSEAQLNDPAQWPGLPPEWLPWKILADNTYLHYEDHTEDLKRFIAQTQK